jgi:ribosome maturation factor RimP
LEDIRAVVDRVARSEGMELVDVEFQPSGSRLLRVFLDKPGGITHADCELVSRQVSTILDVEDLVPGNRPYVLEVSSPGLDRRLVRQEDFRRFAGQHVKIVTRQPLDNRRNFSGVLEGLADDSRVRLRLEQERVVEIALDNIHKANLVPTW